MAYKMVGKKRVWVDDEVPQKSIQAAPVASGLLAPAAPTAGSLTLDQLLGRNVVGSQILDPLSRAAGIQDWQINAGGVDESGNTIQTGVADADKLAGLKGYTFDWRDTGPANTGTLVAYDPTGKKAGEYSQQDQSFSDVLKEYVATGASLLAGPTGLGASLGGALGLSGMAANVVGGGLIGGGTAALTGQDIGKGLLTGGLGGAIGSYFNGPSSEPFYPADFQTEVLNLPASAPTPFYPADFQTEVLNMPASAPFYPADFQTEVLAPTASQPFYPADFQTEVLAPPAQVQQPFYPADSQTEVIQSTFNPAQDSQAYNAANNITKPINAEPPRTVNLGTFENPAYSGGTMGTAGGLSGALAAGTQIAKDSLGTASSFLKDNPLLGRLLTSGAVSLLAGSGSNSSGGSQAPSGPPVQWNSPLQQGLLSPVQQYAPAAITQQRPAGLLAQGFANDGAWRYLKG